jgi:YkoY family integral membrane protein
MFGQTFAPGDLLLIGLLVVLEGTLSIDNALVLGLLAKRLPKELQSRALTYGLVGAFAFRLIAIFAAAYLLRWHWVKLLGGLYLVYVAIQHLFFESKNKAPKLAKDGSAPSASSQFWSTVGVIELTDVAFAVDSILAAIALVGPAPADAPSHTIHPKLWVVVTGGMLGVVLMRVAAVIFIKLLERFPGFEMAAYLLVLVIGLKLLADWGFNTPGQEPRVNFHNYHNWAFWAFWITMLICLVTGFFPRKPKK